ncbi:MAG: hypothetical protein AAF591_08410 [Verrucomicrobiota bacterium]
MRYLKIGLGMIGGGVVLLGLATLVWWLGTDGSAIALANAYFSAGAAAGVMGAVGLGAPEWLEEKLKEMRIDRLGGLRTGWYLIGASAVAGMALLVVMEVGQ